ncbi:MAG: metallophosphoesterase family protein [Bryobacterales bacterium]|nr:metallophosphoesterase family protein [Bryobacterales bacterium]
MALIGLISDTHGLLRPQAVEALRGCAHILHAGDIGGPEIVAQLGALAPVTAIRGNVDTAAWAGRYPEEVTITLAGVRIHMVHDVKELALDAAAEGIGMVVSGHSHKAGHVVREGVHYVNPGSAGPRRFRLAVTVARVDLGVRPWRVEFIELAV